MKSKITVKISYDAIKHHLKPRIPETHKGSYGHTLIIGGDLGYGGAALMAGESAARVGSGLVSVATHPDHIQALLSRCPVLMVNALASPQTQLPALIDKATTVVLGPGLGQSEWSMACLDITLKCLHDSPLPLLIDADGLNMLNQSDYFYREGLSKESEIIYTPHPGEAARLLDCSTREIQNDRVAAVKQLQAEYGGLVILKGPGTLLCYKHKDRQHVDQCAHGNPGMASGGMGDVLSGVIGGLVAQKYSLSQSARLGVCIHSHAADLEAEKHGQRGLLATDLIRTIQHLANP